MISESTVKRIIMRLFSELLRLIEMEGFRKTGGYVLTEKGKVLVKSIREVKPYIIMSFEMLDEPK